MATAATDKVVISREFARELDGLAAVVDAAERATYREIDAPSDMPEDMRHAWAAGYTEACADVRTAIREARDAR